MILNAKYYGQPQRTGVDYFPDKWVWVRTDRYWIDLDGERWSGSLTREEWARQQRWIRETPELTEFGARLTFRSATEYRKVKACPWCGARPQLRDFDCDGWFYTADCGSEQCGGSGGHKLLDR